MFDKKKITIYTTPVCPYCVSAKNLLNSKGYEYAEVDVSDPMLRKMVMKKSQGKKTVPQVFIGDMHVGGFDDLSSIERSGELEDIIKSEETITDNF